MDETGVSVVPNKGSRIIAEKGAKQVGIMKSCERGSLVTVIACFSVGNFVPPMFIFPKKRIYQNLLNAGPAGSIQAVSDSGWTNETIFMEWLSHFSSHVHPSEL